ncbi:MAG: esterase family protein [Clostridia bacterium]|nr:esterase family protein [Clostridia bacterium]
MALLEAGFFSEVLGMCTRMNVILPQSAPGMIGVDTASQQQKWKVLYLLHGLSDDHTIWERRTSIERYVSDLPLAVIMPETQRGWYTDMRHGFKWFTFFTTELPRVVKDFFPAISDKREDTFVAGLSMGGYGALKLALSRPDIYSAAASLSGAVDIAEICENEVKNGGHEALDILGDVVQVRGGKDDLFALCENFDFGKNAAPRLFMCCGTEDMLYWQNVRMRNHIKGLPFDLTYEEEPGTHNWAYWDMKIQSVLKWLNIGREA